MRGLTELLSSLIGTYRGTNTLYDPNADGEAAPAVEAVYRRES